ncbi:MAG TPA: glucose-6-phosphate dehydrogenase [Longimicrobiales bacterium]|nr:glucose-6-phosphate dehydrogenase [Longimicrobiales bacterium]
MASDRSQQRRRAPGPAIFVVFGATGDLAHRKLVPALFDLKADGWLPATFQVLGVARSDMDNDAFRQRGRDGVDRFARHDNTDDAWAEFGPHLHYLRGDVTDDGLYHTLGDRLRELAADWDEPPVVAHYLAVAPTLVQDIVQRLDTADLLADRDRSRVVIEKPFGHDLQSARALNQQLLCHVDESQIYRIDHYLGKETVQNLIAFRFANALFEPIWDRRYIDHVQITVAEQLGVEHRGGYYENAGALRDMIQNHLMQIFCLVAMEPPVTFQANEVRGKKLDLLHAVRPIAEGSVAEQAVRGQYDGGRIDGRSVPPYREESDVDPASHTETFAALKLFVDNWRWQDVPFYLRTGKRLARRVSEVSVAFRPVPHQTFPASALEASEANRLVVRVQPNEGIRLKVQAKRPGPELQLAIVDMRFSYQDSFGADTPDAYETLLLDLIEGDATLFMRADQVEAAWSVVDPVLQAWQDPDEPPALYPAGSWGPDGAMELLRRDGRAWFEPEPDEE